MAVRVEDAEHGVGEDRVDVAWVPGAFEIPTVAKRLAASGRYVAVICLGAVIRGETSHDQHINRAVSGALARLGVESGLPVIFGVLTCNTLEQAVARSGGEPGTRGKDRPDSRVGNKGSEAAEARARRLEAAAADRLLEQRLLELSALVQVVEEELKHIFNC